MSKTLNLSECMLAMGRELQEQGRTREAAKLYTRLVNFRDLDAALAEDVRARLVDLLLRENLGHGSSPSEITGSEYIVCGAGSQRELAKDISGQTGNICSFFNSLPPDKYFRSDPKYLYAPPVMTFITSGG